jgi:hypothetical protein
MFLFSSQYSKPANNLPLLLLMMRIFWLWSSHCLVPWRQESILKQKKGQKTHTHTHTQKMNMGRQIWQNINSPFKGIVVELKMCFEGATFPLFAPKRYNLCFHEAKCIQCCWTFQSDYYIISSWIIYPWFHHLGNLFKSGIPIPIHPSIHSSIHGQSMHELVDQVQGTKDPQYSLFIHPSIHSQSMDE